jgi:hypothetical protein
VFVVTFAEANQTYVTISPTFPIAQVLQLCLEIIKAEYAVLAAPVESPTRLKPVLERRSRRKPVTAAAENTQVQNASETA